MGSKDRLFQEDIEKGKFEKNDEETAEFTSSLTKLEQLLDKYKTNASKDNISITESYEPSSEFEPTESDGSVGENLLPGRLAVKEEDKVQASDYNANDDEANVEDSLDASTETERHTVKFEKNGINYEIAAEPLSETELEIFLENDPGYVSGKVLDYDTEKYNKDGIHQVAWKPDAVEGTKETRVLKAEGNPILCQWSHPGETGSYFCDPDTKYENLQLQDIQEKREQKFYEVIKDLPVEKSVINDQHFLDDVSYDKTYQYVTTLKNEQGRSKTAKELVEAGYLKEINCNEINKK